MVTVDCALLRVAERSLQVLLVQRRSPPCRGSWALPGGFIKMKEPLETAVVRELGEETGLKDISFLTQLAAYGNPGRDPRGRVISVAFLGIAPPAARTPKAGSDAAAAQWQPVEALPRGLAFDHATILAEAVHRLAAGGRSSGILFAFLRDPFMLRELSDMLFAVYGVELSPPDYLKPFLKRRILRRLKGGAYRFTGWHAGKRRR